jgi:hypothetical protein
LVAGGTLHGGPQVIPATVDPHDCAPKVRIGATLVRFTVSENAGGLGGGVHRAPS